MQLDFTADQEALRSAVRDVLAKECTAAFVRAHVEHVARGEPSDAGSSLWRIAVGLDWPALCVAESDGGVGLGVIELAIVAEELGRVIAPGPLSPTICGFVPALRAAGAHDALAAVASGAVPGAVGLADDGGAYSPGAVRTTASRDGDGWVLGGTKRNVVGAGDAAELAVAVMADDEPALVVVSAASAELTTVRALDATRSVAHVCLDGVRVGAERVHRCGADAVVRAAEEIAVADALELIGTCQSIFDTNVAYAKERVQFGVPIGSFQAVKHKLVNMFVAIERARAVGLFAAATIEENDPRRASAAAMAKASAGECSRLVAQDGIQLLGGIGYTWEHDQQLFVKRAKAAEAVHGTAAAHREHIAELLGM
ncbi:MAG: acyl-CoA dehydrogenase family protein [Acidimicrobiales bacterium]